MLVVVFVVRQYYVKHSLLDTGEPGTRHAGTHSYRQAQNAVVAGFER
jgi:hypothetical protein